MNSRVVEELDYCVPRGIPHSVFLSWAELDQDKALAYMQRQNERCSDCGTRAEEWRGDRFAYVAESFVCPGCEIVEQERNNIPGTQKGARIRIVPFALSSDPDPEVTG